MLHTMSRNRQTIILKQLFLISSFVLLFLSSLILAAMSSLSHFSGIVIDEEGHPINNAVVCLQGSSISTQTNSQGHFRLAVGRTINSNIISAGQFGFYNGAEALSSDAEEYRIVLKPIILEDNRAYSWLPPLKTQVEHDATNAGEAKPCEECHPAVTEEWKKDAHSGSATNKVFISFFNGTDSNGKQQVSPGYKLDFPQSNGNCATCHVPALALENPFHADPNEAQGVAKEGIFCDFCHKISGINLDQTGGRPGILSLKFQRPAEGNQLFFGPYPDVFPGEDAYHPLYTKSQYCAPCHHGRFWDVLAYSEFQEWSQSSYAAKNIACQDCHMKPDGKMTRFALEKEGGVLRDPSTIPSHVNFGIGDRAFMMQAITLDAQTRLETDTLSITVTVKNVNAGHHYPTGNPMRHMILLVEVADESGASLPMIKGDRVPAWGGVGRKEDGNYAELPGKGFAKVLKDLLPYPDRRIKRHFEYDYPAPHWRPTLVESDNRIPADGSDVSDYQFAVPLDLSGSIHITVRLISRRAYKKWLDAKKLEIHDMLIAHNNIVIER